MASTVEKPGAEEIRQRFVRWQETRNEQLTAVNRLLIGLTTGALAALLAIAEEAAPKEPFQKAIIAVLVSGGVALVSLASGLWLAVNRYDSFRITARVARMKLKDLTERTKVEKSEIACLMCSYKRKDRWSLCLFRLQVWTFAVSAVCLVAAETIYVWPRR